MLEIILTSTFVLIEIMKKNEEEEKGDMGQRLAQTREQKGAYNNIISELHLVDLPYYRKYICMNPETFKVRHHYYRSL